MNEYQIITFYEFKLMTALAEKRAALKSAMAEHSIKGTIILADEGFNSTICGRPDNIEQFVTQVERILDTNLVFKSTFHETMPFRRIDVKIKPEIVTLKRSVDIKRGFGTHVSPSDWNEVLGQDDIVVLDARNDYEFGNGTFRNAINPGTKKFSDLPKFVAENLDPKTHKKVAMFCTGGIRCEKFAPYMKQLGFEEVYQLDGGILKYLETTRPEDSLWEGECFVFDDRITVNKDLEKGAGPDFSQGDN
ncbi:MAG TPA: rhodanese-like domain-containing protein [Pyrinomonadaceae bacterium]|nr:rhodanese-like domain-containing protein [Pyrinomonadaceae bacterium]